MPSDSTSALVQTDTVAAVSTGASALAAVGDSPAQKMLGSGLTQKGQEAEGQVEAEGGIRAVWPQAGQQPEQLGAELPGEHASRADTPR